MCDHIVNFINNLSIITVESMETRHSLFIKNSTFKVY